MPRTPAKLPAVDSNFYPNLSSAYTLVLVAEAQAMDDITLKIDGAQTNLIHARVVGFFLVEFWKRAGLLASMPCATVVRQVTLVVTLEQTSNIVIYELGAHYSGHLLRAFKKAKSSVSSSSNHASCASFDTVEDMTMDCLEESGTNYKTSKKRMFITVLQALVRDSFRCMLNKAYDLDSCQANLPLYNQMIESDTGPVRTECCHILGQSLTQHLEIPEGLEGPEKPLFTMLSMFGLGGIVDKFLPAGGIHNLLNILTIGGQYHDLFDRLELWLDSTGNPHEYDVCLAEEAFFKQFLHLKRQVCFKVNTNIDVDLPLPDPSLIAIHATCARVAHMSGAAEYFDQCDRDLEDTMGLAEDGSSVHLLDSLLASFTTVSANV